MAEKRKSSLSLTYKVERSNELNILNPKGMNLTEIRFLAIYQGKINTRNPDSRVVTFHLENFCEIMDWKEPNITHFKEVADGIICKFVHLPSQKSKTGFMVVGLDK